ncbi:MAG TPA: TetR/AcrR family transcriptional regulator [Propionicimonas sp.]|jgi:AcrR family transcriptional regulator|uniref:TetR/AcrR family transcriptional regulator n=1 Tax=Propionicimonas sp. TaxID=1955623 RepID=UPI002F3E92AF
MAGAATRVTKAPEVRREELLDLALELCRTQGYEAMSVEQVTRAAGVAKGTFYHYFSSKADLQTQLVRRFGASLFDHLTTAATTAQGTAAARLRVIMDAAAGYKSRHAGASQAAFLYREENYALRHRLFAEWREQARLVLLPVITEGAADGSMHVASAEGATDIVLLLWLDAADHVWARAVRAEGVEAFIQVMVEGSASILQAQERILGLPEGTFAMPLGPEVIHILAELHAKLDRNQS